MVLYPCYREHLLSLRAVELVATLWPDITLELDDIAGWIGEHKRLMFVKVVLKPQSRAHHEFNAYFGDVVHHPREVITAQECQPEVPRIGTRIGVKGSLLQVTHQLKDAAEAECHTVFKNSNRLRAKDFGIPTSGLVKVAARHRNVGDVVARDNVRVVQEVFGRCDCYHMVGSMKASRARLIEFFRKVVTHESSASQPIMPSLAGRIVNNCLLEKMLCCLVALVVASAVENILGVFANSKGSS